MATAIDQIRKHLAYHENAAAALRLALHLITNGSGPRSAAVNGHHSGEAIALALDAKRRAIHPAARKGHATHAALTAQRQRSADLLAAFDPKIWRANQGARSIGTLIRRGY